ncbi:tripeptidyl aminopeptidase [Actinoplanes sp. SE50]|uniref:S28 family serine protease n=1 Tax=unclassified Actinoplanes TaxID=2626549 RepID=UPI00023EC4F4|nr:MULTISPECIES: S28 family serine protease [unclassified Actinoplanes]AEV87017.1 secreted tripeptidyl aminopeptidase [Actinoplanes sp. SE50/110]ATO85415.1 tripeptidyl aminopeptidase [Actinoplanes sp. SE50]SLM02827.1 tripeptidyl aminopeptidase [Actinoplanes sp. SE50/110]
MRKRLVAILACLLVAVTPVTPARAADDPLRDQLTAIPGITVVSDTQGAGYRFFVLTYRQPADHRHPGRGGYEQRLTLLHRSTTAPTVLYTSGYGLAASPRPTQTEPTALLGANQVSVEHRFFTPSRPAPADWSDLDIWQEASDEHRIVTALRGVYTGRWIQTGGSKGGMTSVYHRRFYPGDVDGVVAYVAPDDAINPVDRAYDAFFDTVGTASCRAALDEVQREALRRRTRLVAHLQADAAAQGWTFTRTLGTADRSFEMTVLDSVWAFWQYSTAADCAAVPPATATDDELYAWTDAVAGWSFYTDQGLEYYWPYYYQAASQLGWPSLRFEHLRGLRHYPGLYTANSSLPAELRRVHHPLPMLDVDWWVRTASERMLFVYGQNDPWSAERFTPSRHDSALFVAPGANHGAKIAGLAPADNATATAMVRRWAGVPAGLAAPSPIDVPLDDMCVTPRCRAPRRG